MTVSAPSRAVAATRGADRAHAFGAIDRIGLGLAVTLEFLGPLGVALAGSRTYSVRPAPASASTCWCCPARAATTSASASACSPPPAGPPISCSTEPVGKRLPGLQAPAAATAVSALLYLPVAGIIALQDRLHGTAVLYAVGADILSSVVPYAALRYRAAVAWAVAPWGKRSSTPPSNSRPRGRLLAFYSGRKS